MFLLSPNLVLGQDLIDLGGWNPKKIDRLLSEAGQISDPGLRNRFLSAPFLETPYLPATLIGSAKTAEVFVIRLDAVDCFTLLDYVEALRRSGTFDEFKQTLRSVRYQAGRVDFLHRNHFFSEWARANATSIHNVTELVGGPSARTVKKQLNQKGDGSYYLPGYPVKRRKISYIPPAAVDESLLAGLKDGDYIGIYSPLPGLDVSHCGIVFKKNGTVFLRHASSRSTLKKVVDQELLPYLAGKKGLIIYRPINK
ncbi:MAG: DUF1460 domain-containing protein [Geopsychrobacter sp.]|nr:DUF1460 domain-containing protein [Geopsychrobacter sp.]